MDVERRPLPDDGALLAVLDHAEEHRFGAVAGVVVAFDVLGLGHAVASVGANEAPGSATI